MRYSASARGFFLPEVHGDAIPEDAVHVSEEEYAALLLGQSQGSEIVPGEDGRPALSAPPPPTSEELIEQERAKMVVSRFQARAALFNAGLLASVEAAVAEASQFVQIAWADAQEFRRNSTTIATLKTAVGLTDAQLDQLFRDAALIEA